MLAVAHATAALCALIGRLCAVCSATPDSFTPSERAPSARIAGTPRDFLFDPVPDVQEVVAQCGHTPAMPTPVEPTPPTPWHVRRFQPGDEPALLAVHRSAIERVASRDYTPEQVRAWLPEDGEWEGWARRVRGLAPFVVHGGDGIVGYADLQADGLIDHFYVSGHHPGCGVGAVLMRRIHEEAALRGIAELHAHVSLSAERFFRRWGFEVVERCLPVRRGIALPNALMRKRLSVGADPRGGWP